MSTFKTEIKLGDRYRCVSTGFEGTAESVHFYKHGCERVVVKGINKQGEIVDYSFDAPDLQHVETNARVKLLQKKTGGPHDSAPIHRR